MCKHVCLCVLVCIYVCVCSHANYMYFCCLQSAQNRLLIKNGKVVNEDGMVDNDVYVEDGVVK
jgi:hypothetical protein